MNDLPPIGKFAALRPLARAAVLLCLPLFAGVVGTAVPAHAQAFIKTQEPCFTDARGCVVFRYRTFVRPFRIGYLIRGFGFTAPSAGTALLNFNGTLYCSNGSLTAGHKVVDMVSQIVPGDRDIADLAGPSSLRHANVFVEQDTSMTFNLASTRVVQVPAGPSTFYFVTTSLRRDSGISCFYYSAAFSVSFVP